jgi:hypothetical protein
MGKTSWNVQAKRKRAITPMSEKMMILLYFSIAANTAVISSLL